MLKDIRFRIIRGRSSRSELLCKKGTLKHLCKIRRKTPVLECLFNKVVVLRPTALLTKDSNAGVFL